MILVTGGTGFIGSHLLERLSSCGIPARCLLRPTARPRKLPPGIEPAPGDLASGEGLAAAVDGVDTVLHLAGVTKALRPEDYYIGNGRATRTLADTLSGRSVAFVHVSTLAAIGPSRDGRPVEEDASPCPLTHYGRSKLEAERIVRERLPQAVIVRPPVVYGPRDTDVFQVLQTVARGFRIEISGPERTFSAIYVEDLVEGILAASRVPAARGRAYFLAHPAPATWQDLSLAAARVMGRVPRLVRIPVPLARAVGYAAEIWSSLRRRPGIVSREKIAEAECASWTCDTRRASRELGFTASTSLEEGIARSLAWYKEAGWLNY